MRDGAPVTVRLKGERRPAYAEAYITDVSPREKRTKGLDYIFGIFGLGFVIGPALGGILAAALGPRAPYIDTGDQRRSSVIG